VEVRPLVQSTGEAEFNEVFFDGAFVPDDALVGPVHEGWRVSQSTLGHERGVNPRQLVIHIQHLEELLRLAEATGALDRHRLRQRLAEAYVEVKLFQLHNWRSLSRLARGEAPGAEGSTLKLYWSEMSQRLHATAMDVLGDDAGLWRGAPGLAGDGEWQRSWLYYLSSSVFAGTNEIQRNVIGERVLGLPREPR
jgi:alkylation response protein AidB-like acyl-CoA dehydrogenase